MGLGLPWGIRYGRKVGLGGVPEPSSCRGSQDRPQMPFQRQHALSQRACQLLSSQQQRPFSPGTLPHNTRHGPAGGDCHNASHGSWFTGEDRPGLTAGTAEGLWTSWVRLWSASPRVTLPPQAQTRPLAKRSTEQEWRINRPGPPERSLPPEQSLLCRPPHPLGAQRRLWGSQVP